jgi:hypothetical protein
VVKKVSEHSLFQKSIESDSIRKSKVLKKSRRTSKKSVVSQSNNQVLSNLLEDESKSKKSVSSQSLSDQMDEYRDEVPFNNQINSLTGGSSPHSKELRLNVIGKLDSYYYEKKATETTNKVEEDKPIRVASPDESIALSDSSIDIAYADNTRHLDTAINDF